MPYFTLCLRSCGFIADFAWKLYLAGEDAVPAEGAVPSQEVTGRLDKSKLLD